MFYEITAIYTIMDDTLKARHHQEDPRRTFFDAEVLTTALVASRFFAGHLNHARHFLKETGLMPRMLSESRFNRHWHALSALLMQLFKALGMSLKADNNQQQYLLDSFPLVVCDNIRIGRCRLLAGEDYRGYCAAKRRYFYHKYAPDKDGGIARWAAIPTWRQLSSPFLFEPASCSPMATHRSPVQFTMATSWSFSPKNNFEKPCARARRSKRTSN